MTITKTDSAVLVLEEKNLILLLIATAVAIFGIIALFTNVFGDNSRSLFSLIPFLFSGAALLIRKTVTITLDKTSGKLTITERGIRSKTSNEYDISMIKSVELFVTFRRDVYDPQDKNYTKGSYAFDLAFVIDGAGAVPLDPSTASTSQLGNGNSQREMGEKIAAFLDVPFQERSDDGNIVSTVSSVIHQTIGVMPMSETPKDS